MDALLFADNGLESVHNSSSSSHCAVLLFVNCCYIYGKTMYKQKRARSQWNGFYMVRCDADFILNAAGQCTKFTHFRLLVKLPLDSFFVLNSCIFNYLSFKLVWQNACWTWTLMVYDILTCFIIFLSFSQLRKLT